MEPRTSAATSIESVRSWVVRRDDVVALGLAGSHARGEARADSDIDLVMVCVDPAPIASGTWWRWSDAAASPHVDRRQVSVAAMLATMAPPEALHWLFWDVEPTSLELQQHVRYILARVLERGRLSDGAVGHRGPVEPPSRST
jgi:hypothetical protein